MGQAIMWVSLIILIGCSAFFSSSETALSSMNRIRMKHLYENGNKRAGLVLKMSDNYSKVLTGILIGNNIVNIAASTLGTVIFTSLLGPYGAGVSTLFLTVIILIFGEVTPKSIAKDNPNILSMKFARVLTIIVFIFTPFIFLFDKLKEGIGKFTKGENTPSFTEQELKVIIDEVEGEGVLEEHEGKLVRSALDFDETEVEEAMVPRVDIVSVEEQTDVEAIKNVFLEKGFSRLPIYKKQIDNIIGLLSEKAFFRAYLSDNDFKIDDLLEKPLFVLPQMKIADLLKKLKEEKSHMAIVIDQYGGVDGLITIQNVFEELVGDLSDEKESKLTEFKKINEKSFFVNPDISCDDMFNKLIYKPKDFSTQSVTVGGWVLEQIKKVPKKGDNFNFENLKITVLSVKGKRMTGLKIQILDKDN